VCQATLALVADPVTASLQAGRPDFSCATIEAMHVVRIVFAVGWTAFWIYWIVAAFSMKRGRVPWSRELRIRLVTLIVVVALVRSGLFRHGVENQDLSRAGVGLALFAVGLAVAVWARVNIGRNWGTPMTRKDDPDLVTSGPYRFVRHPIYSGVLLAGIGTAVGLSWQWLAAVALGGIYFGYSARVEERYMTERFPEQYPEYRASTRMLIPFVF
jgi:protein-S-isoprenylcysteine O-methyltransferase Ste14